MLFQDEMVATHTLWPGVTLIIKWTPFSSNKLFVPDLFLQTDPRSADEKADKRKEKRRNVGEWWV